MLIIGTFENPSIFQTCQNQFPLLLFNTIDTSFTYGEWNFHFASIGFAEIDLHFANSPPTTNQSRSANKQTRAHSIKIFRTAGIWLWARVLGRRILWSIPRRQIYPGALIK